MQMQCHECKGKLEKTVERYHYTECGLENVYLDNWEVFNCKKCGTKMPVAPEPKHFTRTVAEALVRDKGRLNGNSILFLRKTMGLRASELADILGVHRVEVSRWENNKVPISPYLDFKLRMEAIDRIMPGANRREMLADVAFLLHRAYTPDSVVGDIEIPPASLAAVMV